MLGLVVFYGLFCFALIPFSMGQVVVEPEFHVFVLEVGVALVSKVRHKTSKEVLSWTLIV